MEEADGWKTYPIVAEASKADMECAIRCSQDNDCLSFILSGSSCYTGTLVPAETDFQDSASLTTNFYTKIQ